MRGDSGRGPIHSMRRDQWLCCFHTQVSSMNQTIHEAAGGREAFIALAHAWHARCLADPVVRHAFSHGFHPQHTERLAMYWAESLGGPATYSDRYGDETSVVRTHSGNGLHEEMDQRAIAVSIRHWRMPVSPMT